ncbi:MAG: hypothetical protein FDX02_06145 [Chlorobium sp.]|nr:MAG: hypothetical protein FDX02_06145 [Chlorobium sp.]
MKPGDEPLAVRWRYDAGRGALVWQLMFTETGDLIGQKRFSSDRRALFFAIQPLTGRVFCDDYLLMDDGQGTPAGEGWFTGIETIRGGLVYCYVSLPHSPEHKGIWCIDFTTGQVVWSRSDIEFIANLEEEFLVCQTSLFGGFPERQFLFVDALTGLEISKPPLDAAQVNAIRAAVVPEELRQRIILPGFVRDGIADELPGLEGFTVSETSRYESIVYGALTVVALHEQRILSALWRSSIKVWRKSSLVYEECMEAGVDKPCLNNFLIQRDNLYYLREREELLCVALS